MKLKIEAIGDELGVMLPDDLVERLNLEQRGSVLTAELEDGGLRLMPYDAATKQTASEADHTADSSPTD